MIDVSMQDLTLQDADLLPTRETLYASNTFVTAFNLATAEGGVFGDADATAIQNVVVLGD